MAVRLVVVMASCVLLFVAARAFGRAHSPPMPPTPPLASERPVFSGADLACTNCHLSEETRVQAIFSSYDVFRTTALEPGTCAGCHVNNGIAVQSTQRVSFLPLSDAAVVRIRHSHAYRQAPDLAATLAVSPSAPTIFSLQRFSECGLRAFLASPVPRRLHATEAMFPMLPGRVDAVVRVSGLAPCNADDGGDATHGKDLYLAKGCAGCHGVRAEAPLLRIGIPLLSRWYFAMRVRKGTGSGKGSVYAKHWVADGDTLRAVADPAAAIMPAFDELTENDVDDLYRYVSEDATDRPKLRTLTTPTSTSSRDGAWSKSVGQAMFRAVQQQVFDTSCRHCHDARPESRAVLAQTFGASSEIEFPLSRAPTPPPSPALRDVLSPGPACSDSRLVARLRARRLEWTGTPAAVRGMPMTLAPLSDETVRTVEAWSRHGCPSDIGDLCDACGDAP
jgi:mono/diheme cytochrome c family protein